MGVGVASLGIGNVAGASVPVARGVIVGRAVGSGITALGVAVRSETVPPQALRASVALIIMNLMVRDTDTAALYWRRL